MRSPRRTRNRAQVAPSSFTRSVESLHGSESPDVSPVANAPSGQLSPSHSHWQPMAAQSAANFAAQA